MKIKTSELSGAALDWAVAMAENNDDCRDPYVTRTYDGKEKYVRVTTFSGITTDWEPSTDWAQGGPIIEREGICIERYRNIQERYRDINEEYFWIGRFSECIKLPDGKGLSFFYREGNTPLIAGMRCYVASVLGDEIDIPTELISI